MSTTSVDTAPGHDGAWPSIYSLLVRQRDDAVPVGRRGAVVLGDVDGQEVGHLVVRRNAVQQPQGLGPPPGEEGVQRRLVVREVLVAQLRIVRLRRQQLAHFQRRVQPVRPDDGQAPHAGHLARHLLADGPGGLFVQQDRRADDLGHAFQPRGQVDDRAEDGHLHLVDGADLAGHGHAGGDADAGVESGQGAFGVSGGGFELAADGQRGAAGPQDVVLLGQRPAPEAHGGVALEIADHAALVEDLMRHHAQGLAHALQQAHQVVGVPLRLAREAAQVAEQHGDPRFARGEDLLGVVDGERVEHDRREELAQVRVLPFQEPHLPQRAERRGDQFGELHVLAKVGRVGRAGLGGRIAVESAGHVERPAALARLRPPIRHGHAEGPVETAPGGERGIRVRRRATIRARPDVHDALALPQRFEDQPLAGLEVAGGQQSLIPVQHAHRRPLPGPPLQRSLDRDDGGRLRSGHAGQNHAHQPHAQLGLARRARDHLRQPAEHLDPAVGVAEGNLLEVLEAERLLLHRSRRVGRRVRPLIDQREGRVADDEMFAGREARTRSDSAPRR